MRDTAGDAAFQKAFDDETARQQAAARRAASSVLDQVKHRLQVQHQPLTPNLKHPTAAEAITAVVQENRRAQGRDPDRGFVKRSEYLAARSRVERDGAPAVLKAAGLHARPEPAPGVMTPAEFAAAKATMDRIKVSGQRSSACPEKGQVKTGADLEAYAVERIQSVRDTHGEVRDECRHRSNIAVRPMPDALMEDPRLPDALSTAVKQQRMQRGIDPDTGESGRVTREEWNAARARVEREGVQAVVRSGALDRARAMNDAYLESTGPSATYEERAKRWDEAARKVEKSGVYRALAIKEQRDGGRLGSVTGKERPAQPRGRQAPPRRLAVDSAGRPTAQVIRSEVVRAGGKRFVRDETGQERPAPRSGPRSLPRVAPPSPPPTAAGAAARSVQGRERVQRRNADSAPGVGATRSADSEPADRRHRQGRPPAALLPPGGPGSPRHRWRAPAPDAPAPAN